MGNNRNALQRPQVARAAENCFRLHGVRSTSLKVVADALGVARQTLYRIFENRMMLLEYIANQRITALSDRLKCDFARFHSLRDALVDGSLLALESRYNDPLLEEIFSDSNDRGLEQFRFRGSPEIQGSMLSIWAPLIERARVACQLRPNLSNEQVVEWIRNIHAAIALRDDYSAETQRQIFTHFLVPSILIEESAPLPKYSIALVDTIHQL